MKIRYLLALCILCGCTTSNRPSNNHNYQRFITATECSYTQPKYKFGDIVEYNDAGRKYCVLIVTHGVYNPNTRDWRYGTMSPGLGDLYDKFYALEKPPGEQRSALVGGGLTWLLERQLQIISQEELLSRYHIIHAGRSS